MTMLATAAILLSALPIGMLCRGDPKRLRATNRHRPGHGMAHRRILAAVALLPGLGLAASGDAAAFLMWLGGCATIGLLAALLTARIHAGTRPGGG